MLTAFQNVELPLLLTKLSKAERRKHVETALGIVGLTDRMNHYPRQLSGGQEQRVAIARAIVADPTFLLCDEPTGDLDRKSADEIMDLIIRLVREYGKTVLMVTHDPVVAKAAPISSSIWKKGSGREGRQSRNKTPTPEVQHEIQRSDFRQSLSQEIRLILTIGSFAVALFLFSFLAVVRGAFSRGADIAGADRLVIINRISIIQPLPLSYRDKILRIPGVKVHHAQQLVWRRLSGRKKLLPAIRHRC